MRANRQWKSVLAAVALSAGLFVLPAPASGQVAGDTDTVSHALAFEAHLVDATLDPTPAIGIRREFTTTIQELAGPGGATGSLNLASIGLDVIQTLLDDLFGFTIPGFVFDVVDFLGAAPPLKIVAGIDGTIGVYFELKGVTGADVDVDYPVTVLVEYPAPNTFGCGDQIIIRTTPTVGAGANLEVTPPAYDNELGLVIDDLKLTASIGISTPAVCIGVVVDGSCVGIPWPAFDFSEGISTPGISLPFNIPPLMTVCADGLMPGTYMPGQPVDPQQFTELLTGCGNNLFSFHNELLNVDVIAPDTVKVSPFPGPLINFPEVNGTFKAISGTALGFTNTGSGAKLTRSGTVSEIVRMDTDMISYVDFAVPQVITAVDLGFLGSIDIGDISPTFFVDHEMKFDVEPTVSTSVDLGTDMAWEVLDFDGTTVVDTGFGRTVDLLAGQDIRAVFPQNLQSPVPVVASYETDADLSTLTKHHDAVAIALRLLEVRFPDYFPGDFTLFDMDFLETALDGSPYTVEQNSVPLSFNSFTESAFSVDPERPVIDIPLVAIKDVVNLGDGERGVVYELALMNSGDVTLSDLTLDLDLQATFATALDLSVECVSSASLVLDPLYDGVTQRNLLAAGNTLGVGGVATLDVLVRVRPEISEVLSNGCFGSVDYLTTPPARATAVSPIGTAIESNVNHCTGATMEPLTASVDLGASVIDDLGDYAVYGEDGVVLARAMQLSRGNVGCNKTIQVLPLTGQFSPDPRIIGDIHVAKELKVHQTHFTVDYAQVGGGIMVNGPFASFTTTGTTSEASDCVGVFMLPAVPAMGGNSSGQVATGGALLPGAYDTLILDGTSTLLLQAGTYDVDWLQVLADGVSIVMDVSAGPVVLNVARWKMLPVKDTSFLVLGGSTRDAQVNYGGRGKVRFRGSLFQGNLLAPSAQIVFDRGSRLEGSCFARRVQIGPQSSFEHHDFLEDLWVEELCAPPLETNPSLVSLVGKRP